MIDLHAIMERSHTEETILENPEEEEIILESPEEVLPKTEVISQNMSKEEDQEINISHMDLSVTMVMLLHTEVMVGEELHHIIEKVEGTNTATTTGLKDTEENPVALVTDTIMITEGTDRALELPEEGQGNIKEKIPDNHQLEVDNLNIVEDQHQEMVEVKISNVGDVVP